MNSAILAMEDNSKNENKGNFFKDGRSRKVRTIPSALVG